MSQKRIEIENASNYKFLKTIPFIAKYVPGKITYSDLPISVIIIDPGTNEEINAKLIDVFPFTSLNIIPDMLCRLATGFPASYRTDFLLKKNNVLSPNQLAFYCYEITT